MHPLLSYRRRLWLYLLAWIPLGVLLGYLLRASGLSGVASAVLAAPLILVYAVALLPVWYTCRALPLNRQLANALGAQAVTMLVAAGLWTALARLLAFAYGWRQPGGASLAVVFVTGILFYLLAATGFYLALEVEKAGEADRRARQAHELAREAELRALKAQINPHFLYNSLNSISALTSADPARAREMCVLLGDFLRRTLALGATPEPVPLVEELALTRSFLAVEQIRFGARLQFDQQATPEALAVRVPPLLLQPLVENAVVHGISQTLDGGTLAIAAACRDHQLHIELTNPFDPDSARSGHSGGVGLANVRSRLRALFGPQAGLQVQTEAGQFRVTLTLPCA